MERGADLAKLLPDVSKRIFESKVLVVGAGGIGCELLKTLILTGFGEIHLVDLDVIDLSNLNRQFLFRNIHIKQSKALVAAQVAQAFNPKVKLKPYHDNIKSVQFDHEWFAQFDVVYNALDNLDARRHVNMMCLSADVPLVESGTTGFHGQVQLIAKSQTECYDCNPKEIPKSFPVCTIRSTPSQPIHCIVWAKSYLFTQLFGQDDEEIPELDNRESAENSEEIDMLKGEALALKSIRGSLGTSEFPRLIFQKVFNTDIERLLSMEEMWTVHKKPMPLQFDKFDIAGKDAAAITQIIQKPWSLDELLAVFVASSNKLSRRFQEAIELDPGATLEFDKDDDEVLDFVVAASNIRAHAFGIETKSKFDIKQMAGNIIPAIATTNAIIAGVCVLESLKIFQNEVGKSKTTYLARRPEHVFALEQSKPPNPHCEVCSVVRLRLQIDIHRCFLSNIVNDILRNAFHYDEDVSVMHKNQLLYDIEEDGLLSKTLDQLHLSPNSILTIVDENDRPRVNLELTIVHKSGLNIDGKAYQVPCGIEVPFKASPKPVLTNGTSNGHIVEEPATSAPVKRLDSLTDDKRSSKRRRLDSEEIELLDEPIDDDVILE